MIYDSFTITVLMTLENLGFCKRGEGGAFVSGGRLRFDGDFPINTDGGGLSSNHPGMRGMFLVIEAVKQLRGECGPRQVKDCALALCHGTGGDARHPPFGRDLHPEQSVSGAIQVAARWLTKSPTRKHTPNRCRISTRRAARGGRRSSGTNCISRNAAIAATCAIHPRALCTNCMSSRTEWVRCAGTGKIYTFTVTKQNQAPGFRESLPYVMAWVELDEGLKMLTNIVECRPDEVKIGMPVEAVFEDVTPEVTLRQVSPGEVRDPCK